VSLLLLGLTAMASGAAVASEADDPLLSLLQGRGLVGAPAAPAAVAAGPQDPAAELVLAAMNFLDIQYRFGGNSADEGFDCSGFTRHVFATALGVSLPRRADEQARTAALQPVDGTELRPGDLVFFNTLRRAFSHVGLYIGDGRFVHAPRTGAQVRVESLRTRYWASRFDGARRIATAGASAPDAGHAGGVIGGWTSPH